MKTSRIMLSALWVAVMLNMAFADLLGFMHLGALQKVIAGDLGFPVTPTVLLLCSLLVEVPILMVVLSLILREQALRWSSTLAAVLTTLFVIGGGSATPSYFFFAAAEVACMAAVVWAVWKVPLGHSVGDPAAGHPV